MAAHESSGQAEHAERRDIGEATLEQMRADVVRLSSEFMTGQPLPLFFEMRRVRDRMHAALDRKLWPRDSTELYFLLGCLNCLMAVAADDLGYPQAAEELIRAGWAYAVAIDHKPLMGRLRMELANISFQHQPRKCRDLAASGLQYLSAGPNGAQLHLHYGRAAAHLGYADDARRAISQAAEARERDHDDDLRAIGGEFDLSLASHYYLAGSTLIEIPGAEAEAAAELERATDRYEAGPGPGETHAYGMDALAHIDLVVARLRAGRLDAAAVTAERVFELPPGKRISDLPWHFDRVRAELAHPLFRGSSQASDLDERIEEYCRDTIVTSLHDLPGGPA